MGGSLVLNLPRRWDSQKRTSAPLTTLDIAAPFQGVFVPRTCYSNINGCCKSTVASTPRIRLPRDGKRLIVTTREPPPQSKLKASCAAGLALLIESPDSCVMRASKVLGTEAAYAEAPAQSETVAVDVISGAGIV